MHGREDKLVDGEMGGWEDRWMEGQASRREPMGELKGAS